MDDKQASVDEADSKLVLQYMLVAPANLPKAWFYAAPLLEKGRKYLADHLSLQDIYTAIEKGTMHLWLVNNAQEIFYLLLTEFIDYPQKRVLHIIYQGGRWKEASKFLDCVEHWAWKNGAVGVELIARKALKRILRPYGYEEPGVYLTKSLRHIREH